MTSLPPPVPIPYSPPPGPTDSDISTLNMLGIFYYVFAGLLGAAGCIPLIYVIFGVIFGVAGAASSDSGGAAAAAGVGGFFVCFGLFCSVMIWIFAGLYFLAGRGLRNQRSLTVCYVAAGLACLNIPLGTVLGVFTFVTLGKPGVKGLFR